MEKTAKLTKILFLLLTALTFTLKECTAFSKKIERIVILSPACADIIEKLNASGLVVGKTKNVKLFPKAKVVGSHIKPNIELVISLKPDLIISSSERFFSKKVAEKVQADYYVYNPKTLDEITKEIKKLGTILNREEQAEKLVKTLKSKLKGVTPITHKPKVVYEVMQKPYMLAGKRNIVVDIIEKAGGNYIFNANRKFIKISCEKVVLEKPDIYIYQVGPMNKNPTPPDKRACFKHLGMYILKVDELLFARPNTKSFDNVIFLNKLFTKWAKDERKGLHSRSRTW